MSIRRWSFQVEVGPSSFLKIKMLGKGDVGRVYLVREKKTSKLYAMKGNVTFAFGLHSGWGPWRCGPWHKVFVRLPAWLSSYLARSSLLPSLTCLPLCGALV
jgi:hypothetical protein